MANTEGARLDLKINQTTNASLESTQRIRDLALDARDKGVETALELNKQGEQLILIEQRTEEIQYDIQQAEDQVTKLETCGWLSRCCKLPRRKRHGANGNGRGNYMKETPVTTRPSAMQRDPNGQTEFIAPVLNDDREKEMNENLRVTEDALKDMKDIATEFGKELDEQDETIKRIQHNVEEDTERIHNVTERLNKQ